MPSRRQFLTGLATGGTATFAGCTDGTGDDDASADELTERWRVGVGPATAQAAVGDDAVFVPVHSDVLALDRESGERRWSFNRVVEPDQRLGYNTTPAVDEASLYVAGGDRTVRAVRLGDQSVQWTFEMNRQTLAPPVLRGSQLYVGGGEYVYCLDAEAGEEVWSRRLFGDVSGLALDGDRLVATTVAGEVYALDAADGGGEWRASAPDRIEAPPVVSRDRVAVACWEDSVYGFDGDGAQVWSAEAGLVDAMTATGETVYANTGSVLTALGWAGGGKRWTADLGTSYRNGTSPPSPAGDAVYVGGDALHAIDPEGGGLLSVGSDRVRYEKPLGGRVGHATASQSGRTLYAAVERNPGTYEYVALEAEP